PNRLPYSLMGMLPDATRARMVAQLVKRRVKALPDECVISVSGCMPEVVCRPLDWIRTWNLLHDWYASRWLQGIKIASGSTVVFHGFQGSCKRSLIAARRA